MLHFFIKNTRNTLKKYNLVTSEPPFTVTTIYCAPDMTQEGSIASCSMLPSRCHSVGPCVQNGSCYCQA